MAGTFTSLYYHLVFSTKHRQPMLGDTIRPRLFEYLGGIVRSDERTLLLAGGIEDHLHLLVSLPPKIPLSDHLRALKSKSSAWLKNNFEPLSHFSWQEGFGAFFREPVQSRFGLKIHPQSTRTSSR
jgi:REP element-mobilizing transposase RayT